MEKNNTLRGIATVNFFADNLTEAQSWYAQLIGTNAYYAFPDNINPAYIEFRLGDYQHELGIIDRKFAPKAIDVPGGAIAYWHVDDINAVFEKLLGMGAKVYQPVTKYGELGFVTASVTDPFGNILGIMYNPHYLEMLSAIKHK